MVTSASTKDDNTCQYRNDKYDINIQSDGNIQLHIEHPAATKKNIN
nr:hypothetical protein [Pedobacter kyonggii]